MTGRTLFGKSSAKGQQLEDHYFASIPERVQTYMIDFEREALKLGIPVLTRHNEVAPGQYECAPMFEELNVAIDHNLLLMDLMHKVAHRHGLRVLLHEKPFAGINGSGKHNNWSMATDKGKNLLSPGENPAGNLQFLTFLINVIKAIHTHEALIRAGVATPGNDHRLGANEAPPAIISVFTGKEIEEILVNFRKSGFNKDIKKQEKKVLDLNIAKIPVIEQDTTDRNRTSPFPFTGNKFEFRAVGSSANCAPALTILNTVVADQLIEFKAEVDKMMAGKKMKSEEAIVSVLQKYLAESAAIIFNGNGYSEEWEKEAKKRGLSNNKQTPEALSAFVSEKSVKLFEKHQIYSKREVHARHEVMLENYIKVVEIEALQLTELSHTHILAAGYEYANKLAKDYSTFKEMGLTKHSSSIVKSTEEVLDRIEAIKTDVRKMNDELVKSHKKKNAEEVALAIAQNVKPYFNSIRKHADEMEMMVDDTLWRLPKYRELLFIR
jgi:glutamine synthetase